MTRPADGWVTARAECEARMFNELAECAEADVHDFKELNDSPSCEFERRPGVPGFRVRLIDPLLSGAVTFQLRDGRIVAKRLVASSSGPVDSSIDGRPVLQFAGNTCLIEIAEGEALEAWQFSRRALEPLFFPERGGVDRA